MYGLKETAIRGLISVGGGIVWLSLAHLWAAISNLTYEDCAVLLALFFIIGVLIVCRRD